MRLRSPLIRIHCWRLNTNIATTIGITEPDPTNEQNWLQLASWPDHAPPGIAAASQSFSSGTSLSGQSIPDTTTCDTTHDWAELTLCEMGRAGIAQNTATGIEVVPTIELPDSTNISTSEVDWLIPTNYAKTFHPRSLGHLGIRNIVRATW